MEEIKKIRSELIRIYQKLGVELSKIDNQLKKLMEKEGLQNGTRG